MVLRFYFNCWEQAEQAFEEGDKLIKETLFYFDFNICR